MAKKRISLGILLVSLVVNLSCVNLPLINQKDLEKVFAKSSTIQTRKYNPSSWSDKTLQRKIDYLTTKANAIQSVKELKDFLASSNVGLTFNNDYTDLSYDSGSDTWFAASYDYFNGIVNSLDGLLKTLSSRAQRLSGHATFQSHLPDVKFVSTKSNKQISSVQKKYRPSEFTYTQTVQEIIKLDEAIMNIASLKELEKFLVSNTMGLTFNDDYTVLSCDQNSDTWFAANYSYFNGIVKKLDDLKQIFISKAEKLLKPSNVKSYGKSNKSSAK